MKVIIIEGKFEPNNFGKLRFSIPVMNSHKNE